MTHTILTIDDHPDTLEAVQDTLEAFGYRVFASLSPFTGLEIAEAEQPDLILLDVNMPGMSGTEFARKVRAHGQLSTIPIIMFTAEHLADQKKAGFEAGADDYLIKPTNPDVLINRIEAILGKSAPTTLAPTPKSKVIALVGSHGGAGTTTLAINLALVLASNRPTTLIDYDLTHGHIALYLNYKTINSNLNQFAQQPATTENVHQNLVSYADKLDLMLTIPNPLGDTAVPDQDHTQLLLQTVTAAGSYVVVDLGSRLYEANWPIIKRADDIYVCVQPNRIGLASARYLLRKLARAMTPSTYLSVIGFQVGNGETIPQEAVENYLKRPLTGFVTIHPKEMSLSINQATPLTQMNASPAGATIRQIAQKIAERQG